MRHVVWRHPHRHTKTTQVHFSGLRSRDRRARFLASIFLPRTFGVIRRKGEHNFFALVQPQVIRSNAISSIRPHSLCRPYSQPDKLLRFCLMPSWRHRNCHCRTSLEYMFLSPSEQPHSEEIAGRKAQWNTDRCTYCVSKCVGTFQRVEN